MSRIAGSWPTLVMGVLVLLGGGVRAAGDRVVKSPDGNVQFRLFEESKGLAFDLRFRDRPVVETSALRIAVDGVELTKRAIVGKVEDVENIERFAVVGRRTEAIVKYRGGRIAIRSAGSHTDMTLEVRAFNNGAAFRWIIPGDDKSRVPDETTSFVLPAKSSLWYHDLEGHYEGTYKQKPVSEIAEGQWLAPPLTFRLPEGDGFASITEAALVNYSGMALRCDGQRGFELALGHKHPPSYPFRLRYAADVERMSKPAAIDGTITTPWRVVIVGCDLNALVQSEIVNSLCPPPEPKLFPEGAKTEWIKPGRAVWRYLDGGSNSLADVKEFSRLAGQLGFEYQVVEGFWSRWTDAQIKEAVDYSRSRGVGLWFWRHSKQLRTAEEREAFFKKLSDFGVVGAKIDFFDHEHRDVVALYQTLLKDAARYKIMVNFHGANKPTGESRTWPNELIREGIRGMEASRLQERAKHNTTLPFTRYLAGPGDYTPVLFGPRRGDTTAAHQIATAAVFNEPLLTYGAHPKTLLDHPAVEMIKCIPSVWDETIALPMSEIGELAAVARRRGDTWFLAILNGPTAKSVKAPLTFLGTASYECLDVRDDAQDAAAVKVAKSSASRDESLTLDLCAGGGYVARFTRTRE